MLARSLLLVCPVPAPQQVMFSARLCLLFIRGCREETAACVFSTYLQLDVLVLGSKRPFKNTYSAAGDGHSGPSVDVYGRLLSEIAQPIISSALRQPGSCGLARLLRD